MSFRNTKEIAQENALDRLEWLLENLKEAEKLFQSGEDIPFELEDKIQTISDVVDPASYQSDWENDLVEMCHFIDACEFEKAYDILKELLNK